MWHNDPQLPPIYQYPHNDALDPWRVPSERKTRRQQPQASGLGWLLLGLLLLAMALSGCESMERGVAKLHGITVDPLPGPCAPESFQAGQCIKVKQEGGKP